MKLLSLIATIFFISNTIPAWGTCTITKPTVTLSSSTGTSAPVGPTGTPTGTTSSSTVTSAPVGATVTLSTTVSGCGTIGEVDFYNGQSLLCASNSPASTINGVSTYSCPWAISESAQSGFTIDAVALGNDGYITPSLVNPNTVIDMVGNPSAFPSNPYPGNPALDPSFGKGGSVQWIEGDNQMCLLTYAYNGASPSYPDGTCELSDSSSTTPTNNSTEDALDHAMHTLSDFANFSNTLLSQGVGTLSANFNRWYPHAAAWIAPKCLIDTGTDSTQGGVACNLSSDPTCTPNVDPSCYPGSAGRLLSIYDPMGYPNVPGNSNNNTTPVDKFGNWNAIITNWLNNTYISPDAWCVPPQSTFSAVESGKGTVSIAEKTLIQANSVFVSPTTFVKAFPNPPSGKTEPGYGNTIFTWLVANNDVFSYGMVRTHSTLPSSISDIKAHFIDPGESKKILNILQGVCSDGGACSTSRICPDGYGCSARGTCVNGDPCPTSKTCSDGNECSQWGDMNHIFGCMEFNGGLNFGTPGTALTFNYSNTGAFSGTSPTVVDSPAGNYGNCLNLLQNKCPASGNAKLTGTVCDAGILGRSLATVDLKSDGSPPDFVDLNGVKNSRCDHTVAGSYAKYVYDSWALYSDEAPKFALRYQYLKDIYSRAQTMQTIFGQAEKELYKFLLPCRNASNCSDGGPAAQLIYGKSQPTRTAAMPNSLIYGWVDNPLPGQLTGNAHIVKVTAYSPGRNVGGYGGAPFVSSGLPTIKTSFGFFTRTFWLDNPDGYVYVSVKRWDQEHNNATNFPNNHSLWQFLFHNPKSNLTVGTLSGGFPTVCRELGNRSPFIRTPGVGWGLETSTLSGLMNAGIEGRNGVLPVLNDETLLGNAFMLNDIGDGSIDPNSKDIIKSVNSAGISSGTSAYHECLGWANYVLDSGVESHACAKYIASSPTSDPGSVNSGHSSSGDADYSIKFVDCSSVPGFNSYIPPEDLIYTAQATQ